jgi:hypothetical protein
MPDATLCIIRTHGNHDAHTQTIPMPRSIVLCSPRGILEQFLETVCVGAHVFLRLGLHDFAGKHVIV